MNEESPQSVYVPRTLAARSRMFRALLYRDKTPLAVLLCAALVGTLVGLAGVAFARAVEAIQQWRATTISPAIIEGWPLYAAAFAVSALLAMVGYLLVKRFAPEAGGSGIPEIEGTLEELRPVRW